MTIMLILCILWYFKVTKIMAIFGYSDLWLKKIEIKIKFYEIRGFYPLMKLLVFYYTFPYVAFIIKKLKLHCFE